MADASPSTSAGRLVGKALLLSAPFWALALSYLVFDPFWVLYRYPTFPDHLITIPNRDYISTQMYLNTCRQRPYRSFILGNSRSLAFRVRDWSHYTGDTLAFHFDAAGESLYGVWTKLRFLEQHAPGLDHVLLVADADLFRQTQDVPAHMTRKDPRVTGELPFAFQLSFFKAYATNGFFLDYLRRRFTPGRTPAMAALFESRRVHYDPLTNDMSLPDIEQEIRTDSLGYYARNRRLPPRAARPAVAPAVIGAVQLAQLEAIRSIFRRRHTRFHLVISPLYDQRKLNPADVAILLRVFGPAHVHDFSGANRYTRPAGNYYEQSHYRPAVGRQLLRAIYAPTPAASAKLAE